MREQAVKMVAGRIKKKNRQCKEGVRQNRR
jgi:hypothetical protein